ncbi:MAG: ribosomal protein S18-alanine N-acetyltransferase [Pseudomonadota bacterium]
MAHIHSLAFVHQRPWSRAEFEALLDQPSVAAATLPKGFGLIRIIAPEAELLTLAVAPDEQRQGQGRRLLAQLCEKAQSRKCHRMILEVAAGNSAALALYRATGFEECGRRPAYYRYPAGGTDDAIIMARTLEN